VCACVRVRARVCGLAQRRRRSPSWAVASQKNKEYVNFSSYRAVNTLRLGYKNQSVTAV
jgi:hypothetical protein